MWKTAGALAWRLGAFAKPSDVPDQGLCDFVETHAPARALDLGCASGRNALYLAANGWDTTGVELIGPAVHEARQTAAIRGLNLSLVQGDVTKLPTLGLGDEFDLLMDGGCYHTIPESQRDAYARSISAVAAPGATLILVGFTQVIGRGMRNDELPHRLTEWELIDARAVPGEEMCRYIKGPAVIRAALRKGRFGPWRYRFKKSA